MDITVLFNILQKIWTHGYTEIYKLGSCLYLTPNAPTSAGTGFTSTKNRDI